MDKSRIIDKLKKFIQNKKGEETDKKTSQLLSVLASVEEADLSFGEAPTYFFANIKCNSTGVGESSFQGTQTQRTIARDYVTDECLFIDGHIGIGEKGLSLFFLKPGQTVRYYPKSDAAKVAKRYGFQLHSQYFRDLNFRLTDHRLNRYTVNITKGPFTYPIRPIYATVSDDHDKIVLGYVYELHGEEHIVIEPERSSAIGKKAKIVGCAPWMLLCIVFPPLLLVAGFVWLVKREKERMVG